jgi:hypothetical protein
MITCIKVANPIYKCIEATYYFQVLIQKIPCSQQEIYSRIIHQPGFTQGQKKLSGKEKILELIEKI